MSFLFKIFGCGAKTKVPSQKRVEKPDAAALQAIPLPKDIDEPDNEKQPHKPEELTETKHEEAEGATEDKGMIGTTIVVTGPSWAWTHKREASSHKTNEDDDASSDSSNAFFNFARSKADFLQVSARGANLQRELVFATPILDEATCSKLKGVQLSTSSCDQGWCDDPTAGSWSWFELGVIGPNEPTEDDPEGPPPHSSTMDKLKNVNDTTTIISGAEYADLKPKFDEYSESVVFESHRNKAGTAEFQEYTGKVWVPDDELFKYIKPGVRIGVWACAQYGGWSNKVKQAKVQLHEA